MGNTMKEPKGVKPQDGERNGVTEANEAKKRALLDFLNDRSDDKSDFGEGVSAYDGIERIIEQELAKGDDLDADLLFEAAALHLERLGEKTKDETTEERAARLRDGWNELLRQHEIRQATQNAQTDGGSPTRQATHKRTRGRRVLRKIAAAFACCLILGTLSISAAYAFRWEFLIHFFQPLMETLGIHMNLKESEQAGDLVKSAATPELAQEQTELPGRVVSKRITDITQVPDEIMGYRAKPTWVPEGYVFEYAEYYDDIFDKRLFVAYTGADGMLYSQFSLCTDPSLVMVYDVEKVAQSEGKSEEVDGVIITEDFSAISATYTDDLAYYRVWGKLSREDILSTITSLIRS